MTASGLDSGVDRVADCAAAAADASRSCLVAIYGPKLGERVSLEDQELTLGRGSDCDICVDLADVSRQHCRFSREGDEVLVEDLSSTNGTFLNGEEIREGHRVALKSRDLVKVGGAIFRFLGGEDLEILYREEMHRVAIVDGLTQIYNERYFREFLEREIARSRRHRRPLSLLIFDVDNLNSINDAFGRLAGDAVLRDLASRIKGRIRSESCFARLGGDEFAISLPELEVEEGKLFARILSELVAGQAFEFQGLRFAVTISTGTATLVPPSGDVEGLLRHAREQLALERRRSAAYEGTREVLPPGSGEDEARD